MNPEIRLKRLYYRSCHRGNKESDVLLSRFADLSLPQLDATALDVYEAFLDQDDADIWDWVVGKDACPVQYEGIVETLRKQVGGE